MDQLNQQHIELGQISKDIEKIGEEIIERKLLPEVKNYSERDLINQAIKSKLYPLNPNKQDSIPQTTKENSENDKFLPDYLKDSSVEIKEQVEILLKHTITHGLEKGIREAVKMPPFILDAYHDALVDKLHEELKKRKII